VLDNAGRLFQEIAYFGLAMFLWFLSFYYFLRDGQQLKKILVAFSPLSDRYDLEIVKRVQISVKSVIGGSLIVAVIQGVLAGVGFAIFGVPSPTIWGFVAIIAALVPTVGTALIMLPAVAYLFITNNTVPAIGLLLWSLLIVGSVDNIIRPKLIERGIHIHPLMILLSVLGGIALFGPVGFLTGPIIMSLLAEFVDIYQEMVLHKHPVHASEPGSHT
jgi:predicted PurR-regulated permease PerM